MMNAARRMPVFFAIILASLATLASASDYVPWYGTIRVRKLHTVNTSTPIRDGIEVIQDRQEWSGTIRYLPNQVAISNGRFVGSHLLDRRISRMETCPWKDEKTAFHDFEIEQFQESAGGTLQSKSGINLLFEPDELDYEIDFTLKIPSRDDGISYKLIREFYNECSNPHMDHKEQSVKSSSNPFSVSGILKGTAEKFPPEQLEGSQTVIDENGEPVEVSWKLKRSAPPVVARIVAPTLVKRAQDISFNSATSTGKITSRKWSFALGDDCGDWVLPIDYEMIGAQVKFKAYCSFTAWLEVEDAQGQYDRASHEVIVERREGPEWRTKYSTSKGAHLTGHLVSNGMQLGVNQCALHSADETSGHMIHTDAINSGTWLDSGYKAEQIVENGPFKGIWFIKSQELQIKRVERVNQELYAGGNAYKLNASKNNLPAIDALRAQVTAHEEIHSSLVSDALIGLGQERDPAQRIEKMLASDRDLLQEEADIDIRYAETEVREATSEDQAHNRLRSRGNFSSSVSIWLPDSYGNPILINMGPLWNIGDRE